ncbi:MAG: type II toxin-antitoxin system VapC family toxin [Acidobacteriia bacterium]|nr:type II toxin-antitoxin system VapC family toxin [Terriglobia bacterium]
MKRYMLDASAVIAFLEDRGGAEVVEDLLGKAASSQQFLQVSVVNWGEIYSAICRVTGREAANRKIEELEQLPIELVDVDSAVTKLAAELSAQYKLPYLSCIGAATAKTHKATFVTAEKEFESVGNDLKLLLV